MNETHQGATVTEAEARAAARGWADAHGFDPTAFEASDYQARRVHDSAWILGPAAGRRGAPVIVVTAAEVRAVRLAHEDLAAVLADMGVTPD